MATGRAGELSAGPSEWALRELPARAATFLSTVGSHGAIRGALRGGGYRTADHEEGIQLMAAACALRPGGVDPAQDEAPRLAAKKLEEWSATHVGRLSAALRRLHPDEPSPFDGIDFSSRGDAVLGVTQLLGALRRMTAHASAAAMSTTLAHRGLDEAERAMLDEWVALAQGVARPDLEVGFEAVGSNGANEAEPAMTQGDDALIALHGWYEDWATTAKALIRRKDWLLQLGVRRRRRR